MRRDVFQAIADPTRREIISMIAHQPLNINAVTEKFDVSRMAIYKHIKILNECGLLAIRQQGRERFCEVKIDNLNEVAGWVEDCKKIWAGRLDNLDDYLKQIQNK